MQELSSKDLNEVTGGVPGPGGKEYWFVYTVNYGDTLTGIGARYGVDFMQIAKCNGILDPDKIYVGQNLYIPFPGRIYF